MIRLRAGTIGLAYYGRVESGTTVCASRLRLTQTPPLRNVKDYQHKTRCHFPLLYEQTASGGSMNFNELPVHFAPTLWLLKHRVHCPSRKDTLEANLSENSPKVSSSLPRRSGSPVHFQVHSVNTPPWTQRQQKQNAGGLPHQGEGPRGGGD